MYEQLQHVLIPKIFALGGSLLNGLLRCESQIRAIAKVEVILYDVLAEFLNDFFVLCLIYGPIE